MPSSPGEENEETQGVAHIRNMGIDLGEKTAERPGKPGPDHEQKREIQALYWEKNRQVKKVQGKIKKNVIKGLTQEAETAAGQRNMKRLYEITRTLSGKNNQPSRPVKDKNGNAITSEDEQRARWAEHFKETLNRPAPPVPPIIPPPTELLDINTNPPTKNEITKAIKSLKSGKAAGPDGIPPEALKADIQTSTDMLHPLLHKIWEQETVPEAWKKGHLVKLPKKGGPVILYQLEGYHAAICPRENTDQNNLRETEDCTRQEAT